MASGVFDLILLDVGLPDMDGFTVCRQLKDDARTREVPVIFLTSRNSAQDEVKGLEAGGIDYIAKPINPAILRARVNNHVELKHSRDALTQMARLDGLTGLSNRRTFDDMLDREWRRLARVGQHLSIIMFDVDHFKLFNDTYGHGAGDICLKKIAQCAVNALQRPADMVALMAARNSSRSCRTPRPSARPPSRRRSARMWPLRKSRMSARPRPST